MTGSPRVWKVILVTTLSLCLPLVVFCFFADVQLGTSSCLANGLKMSRDAGLITLKKNYRVHVSKDMCIVKSWYVLRPFVVEHIAGSGYVAIPYFLDTKAYQIGHIFVQESSNVQCFCAAPQLKVLGPIRDFLVHEKSNAKWLDKNLPVIKTTDDNRDFRVNLYHGKHKMDFKAIDCYFLDKAPDLLIEGEMTIDRSTHEDLATADWFGLITGVLVTNESAIRLRRNYRERTFYIGERPHTILFKYEICKMDKNGSVFETSTAEMDWKWLPVEERDMNALPVTEFVSQSTRVKS